MIIELGDCARINLTAPPYDTEGLSMVILGNKGAGKSNVMKVMAEEAHRNGIPFFYFDPKGGAAALRELGPDVVVVGDTSHPVAQRRAHLPLANALEEARDYVRMVLKDGFSLALDMAEGEDPDLPQIAFQALINEHFRQAGHLRTPCFVFVDEAHIFAPQSGADALEKKSLKALGKMTSDGRSRGIMLVVASQRATYLSKKVVYGANVRLFGKITYWPDYDGVVRHYIPVKFNQMKGLKSGEVFVIGERVVNSEHPLNKVQIRRAEVTDLDKTPVLVAKKELVRPSLHQLQMPF